MTTKTPRDHPDEPLDENGSEVADTNRDQGEQEENTSRNVPAVNPPSGRERFRSDARRFLQDQERFEPILPEPEMPQNSLARLYTTWAKNEIEWKVYKEQYTIMAEKQAELLKERATHIIAKAREVHQREIEQLREILSMHNSEVISGLQRSAHEVTQDRLLEIADEYVRQMQRIAEYPSAIRETLLQDANSVWDYARRKILKYALEKNDPEE
jgi:hypothetical protein